MSNASTCLIDQLEVYLECRELDNGGETYLCVPDELMQW